MRPFVPDEIWIERGERDTPIAQTVLARTCGVPVRVVDDLALAEPTDFATGKRRLVLQRNRGTFLKACPAGTPGLVCCNYLVVSLASNCPLDCTYCFLQDYVANNPALKAFTNVDDALGEVAAVLRAHPDRLFRIGTGEVADSLALDPITGLSRLLVPYFAGFENAQLELKTKTDCVDDLLEVDPRGRVVVAWSVNAPEIVACEEAGTATLEERLAAARRVQQAGYRLGFHFDPLVEFEGWESGYQRALEAIADGVDLDRVAWVSLGSLRMTPPLARVIRARQRGRHVLAGELVPCADGKSRVWLGLRVRMYRFLVERLRAMSPSLMIYLCMETPGVWERVMADVPSDRGLGLRLASGERW